MHRGVKNHWTAFLISKTLHFLVLNGFLFVKFALSQCAQQVHKRLLSVHEGAEFNITLVLILMPVVAFLNDR